MYVRGKRLQKGSTHSSSRALQQRRTDGRRHTGETTETGACDYTGRSWKGRRNVYTYIRISHWFFVCFAMKERCQDAHDEDRAFIYKQHSRQQVRLSSLCFCLRDPWFSDGAGSTPESNQRLAVVLVVSSRELVSCGNRGNSNVVVSWVDNRRRCYY